MRKISAVGVVAAAILFFSLFLLEGDAVEAEKSESETNLLKNGDFEDTAKNDNWKNNEGPENWSQWKAAGDPELVLDNETSHSGKRSANINASSEGRASVEQMVAIQAEKDYKITGWIKTDHVKSKYGARIRLAFQNSEDEGSEKVFKYTNEVSGTSDWTKVELIVNAPKGYDKVNVQSFLEKGTGSAWFDDITLEEYDADNDVDDKIAFSFESEVPKAFSSDKTSSLDITKDHHKDGKHSLEWGFDEGSQILINNRINYRNKEKDVFGVWIYNEKPIDNKLLFQFGHDGKVNTSFKFNLNFKGWRTAWVPFKDMEGNPRMNMDELTITAPDDEEGTLFFDQMILSSPVDVRYPTRDKQVPFVNKGADDSPSANWQSLYLFDSWLPEEFETDGTDEEEKAVDSIEKKFWDFAINNRAPKTPSMSRNITDEYMEEMRNEFDSYDISRKNGTITGRSLVLDNIKDIYPNEVRDDLEELTNAIDVRDYTDLMKKVAIAYHSTDKEVYKDELEQMFMDLVDHMYDQGWANGSSLGSIHHYGYQIRSFYPAIFLMKDVLEENERLERMIDMVGWYSGIGRIYEDLDESYGDTDIFNTNLRGMLSYVLLQEDPEERVGLIKRLDDWLSNGLQPAPGLMPMLKPDGSAYHHKGSYPAYARDSFEGLTPVVYMMSGTPFSISESAHETLKKAVLTTRLYSNKYDWLVGIGGRHPTNRLNLESYPFKYMALAGSPDGKDEIDSETAEAYLRLVKSDEEDEITSKLRSMGYGPEATPNGNWTMNHSVLALHRRDDWLVGVMGHNRYHWSNEIYASENLYGRYTNYGQIQILDGGDPVNYEDSDYTPDKGWDWNRWPGTTTKHLPLDKLKAENPTEMLLTDEAYAGGLNIQGENGMYAMKLHESPKYDDSFRARKSVFMFGNRIIALGSDIEDEDSEYNTETTIFQNHLENSHDSISMSDEKNISDFPYEKTLDTNEDKWILDNKENGYYIPSGQKLNVRKQTQESRDHHDKKDTEGDFATAWIDHGKAPDDESYEYAILVDSNEDEMTSFTQEMEDPDHAPYTVLQKDKKAHIVRDNETKTTGYAIMEANDSLEKGHIISADTPSMVMVKEVGDGLILSEVDPDWRLYEGKDPDQYDENGNFVGGVSPMAVSWQENSSKMHKLQLTIKGEWELKEKRENYRIVSSENDRTVLEFDNKDAMPIEIELSPKSDTIEIDDLDVLVEKYIKSQDIEATFGKELEYRLSIIHNLFETDNIKQASEYLEDFSKHINDPSVQQQQLISEKATKDLNRGIEQLLEKWDG